MSWVVSRKMEKNKKTDEKPKTWSMGGKFGKYEILIKTKRREADINFNYNNDLYVMCYSCREAT